MHNEQLPMLHRMPCKFSEQYSNTGSFLASRTSRGPPALSLIVQYQATYCGGYVKSKVYEARAANTDDLKRRIRESVAEFPKDMLQCVMTFLSLSLQNCVQQHGRLLQSVIFDTRN
jgi:hypothetical protein